LIENVCGGQQIARAFTISNAQTKNWFHGLSATLFAPDMEPIGMEPIGMEPIGMILVDRHLSTFRRSS
jgi:hypothetical protein